MIWMKKIPALIDEGAAPHDRLCEGEDGGCFCGVRATHIDGEVS